LGTSFDQHAVIAGTELEGNGPGDVNIFGWDARKPDEVKLTYSESHTDTVTELRFIPHPQSSALLLSASTDGLINIFDTATAEEDDALFQVINHKSAIQHAGIVDRDIYALGTDETLSFHAFQNPDPEAEEPLPMILGDVRESFGCEYVVNVFHAGTNPFLAVGNHSEEWLDLIGLKNQATTMSDARNWTFNKDNDGHIRLSGAHQGEVIRDVFVTQGVDSVFTCGEDGMVRLWKGEGDTDVEMGGTTPGKRRYAGEGGGKERRSKSSRHV
jgi:WD40 repeat protein